MNGKQKILSHAHRGSAGPDDLVGEYKLTGGAEDMSSLRKVGASFVVNIDGRPVPTMRLAEDGVVVGRVKDSNAHTVEFFISGRSVFRQEGVHFTDGVSIPFSLFGQTGSEPASSVTKRFVVTLRNQTKRVTAFRVGVANYPVVEMGPNSGVYTSDQVTLPTDVDTTLTVVYSDNTTKQGTVHPPVSATEIELVVSPEAAPNTSTCSLSAETLRALNLDPSAICNGNVVTMANGAQYRVEVDGSSARLVLIPKEESIVEKLAVPALMLAAGGGLLWHGMSTRKAREAAAAKVEAKQNPFQSKRRK